MEAISGLIGLIIFLVFFGLIYFQLANIQSFQKDSLRGMKKMMEILRYSNYKKDRISDSSIFKLPTLKESQKFICINPSSIPNESIGHEIVFIKYYTKSEEVAKYKQNVADVRFGNHTIHYLMPNDGKIIHLHKDGSFLSPNDPVYIYENTKFHEED